MPSSPETSTTPKDIPLPDSGLSPETRTKIFLALERKCQTGVEEAYKIIFQAEWQKTYPSAPYHRIVDIRREAFNAAAVLISDMTQSEPFDHLEKLLPLLIKRAKFDVRRKQKAVEIHNKPKPIVKLHRKKPQLPPDPLLFRVGQTTRRLLKETGKNLPKISSAIKKAVLEQVDAETSNEMIE